MTSIEQQALALVNEVRAICRSGNLTDALSHQVADALESAIERAEVERQAHAATAEGILKTHEVFKQDVSDFASGVRAYMQCVKALAWDQECARFIIPAPVDPLVEVFGEFSSTPGSSSLCSTVDRVAAFRKALAARGLKIVEADA